MVHAFELNGYRIALDSASGAVHVLSEPAYKILQKLVPPLSKEPPVSIKQEDLEVYSELYELYLNGMLFSEDIKAHPPLVNVIKSMCLHISHDCNMRCKYCFAGTGDFNQGRTLMNLETGRAAIDFLIRESKHIINLEIDFFGGEPLLNFDVIRKLVFYGREEEKKHNKNIRFTITTNGTLLDNDSIDFINLHMSNAVLSIDGRKCVNDETRTFEDGTGTYDTILPKFKELVSKRTNDYYVRGTFTRENKDFAEDVLHLANQGFDQVSVEPVVLSSDSPLSLRESDLPDLFKEYERLAIEMIKRSGTDDDFNFFHFMLDLDAGPCVYKRIKGCGSGSEYIAITPDGDIYPCHQFVGYPEYKMGNIHNNSFDKNLQSLFLDNNITTLEQCNNCWAKYYCGGGCAANNYMSNRDINSPYNIGCELEKKRIECALMIKAATSN